MGLVGHDSTHRRHSPKTAEISKDIKALMDSLDANGVYKLTPGRVFDGDGQLAADVVEVGLHALLESGRNPLKDYNTSSGSASDSESTSSSSSTASVKVEDVEGGVSLLRDEGQGGSDSDTSADSAASLLSELEGNPLYQGDVGEGAGDEAAMPRRTEADVAFDMDIEDVEDVGGDETDSDGEVGEDGEWLTDDEV